VNPAHRLDQAEHLTRRQAVGRPRATDLRGAVSSAYYAVFHTLTTAGAVRQHSDAAVRNLVSRSFEHRGMKDVARQFANKSGKLWAFAVAVFETVPTELLLVAELFVRLQEARHRAEYDLRRDRDFTRPDARELVDDARTALRNWDTVRNTPQAQFFLLALLLKDLARFAD
jgi:hypothetical protein